MKHKFIIISFEVLALLLLDIIAALLLFNIWALINLPLFPWALSHIILALIILHTVVITSQLSLKTFGVPFTATITALSLFYYIFSMLFTGLSYPFISVISYILISMLAFLVFLLCCFGLYFSGLVHRRNTLRCEVEKSNRLEWQMALMQIGQVVHNLRQALPEQQYHDLSHACQLLEELITALSPAGHSDRPEIVSLEQQVRVRLDELTYQLGCPVTDTDPEQTVSGWIARFGEIRQILVNRERLLVQ